jgi:hypothetical protein
VIDRAFDPALQDEIFVGAELAFEAQRGTQHCNVAIGLSIGLRGRGRCARHGTEGARRDRLLAFLKSEVTH